MSDYGSDIDEWTADVLLAADDHEYGSEIDDAVAKDVEIAATAAFGRERALRSARYRLRAPIELPSSAGIMSAQAAHPVSRYETTVSAILPQTESAFLQLPTELRNSIYTALFDDTTSQLGAVQYRWSHPVGILLACRQTHFEAIGLFYNLALFVATDFYALRRCFIKLSLASRTLISRVGLHSLALRREYEWGDLDQYARMAGEDIEEAKNAFKADTCLQVRPTTVTASFLSPTGLKIWSQTPVYSFEHPEDDSVISRALQDTPKDEYWSANSVHEGVEGDVHASQDSISEVGERREWPRMMIGERTALCRR